ncbi:MAG: hypothetical protein NZ889_01610 [Candidatus Pacearchaeota archaeon]|nr:hypothetical protein [Candidatus Pacearchaeota archaeon]
MEELCIKCKGRGFCKKPCKLLHILKKFQPKLSLEFSGSSPPEIFVGRYNYPYIFSGIITPAEHIDSRSFSMPEIWYKEKKNILEILNYRSRMVYSRFLTNVKGREKLKEKMQELAIASFPVDATFKLKKKPKIKIELDKNVPMIGNPAPVEKIVIESNIKTYKKVEYLINDKDVKAEEALMELYSSKIPVSHIIRLLSAGLLGLKFQRKLVPTRWAVTATDNIISEKLLEKIRHYKKIDHYEVFRADYLGNYYKILLMPYCWSFEVIEVSERGYFGLGNFWVWHDYEFFYGRKNYAKNVGGAYYANRLAVAEYLEKIKKQASCIILREIRGEYWAPCGVGILRECCRDAFRKKPEIFYNLEEAIEEIARRTKIPIQLFLERSKLLREIKEQKNFHNFFRN